MQSILPWVGIVILFLTGWAVVKKYQVNMVLLLGGLALNILAVAGGLTSFLPKNAAATALLALTLWNCCERFLALRLPALASLFLSRAVLLNT